MRLRILLLFALLVHALAAEGELFFYKDKPNDELLEYLGFYYSHECFQFPMKHYE